MRLVGTLVFPLFQIFGVYVCYTTLITNPAIAAIGFVVSILALNFTVHVSLHEFVHHYLPKTNYDPISFLFSIFAGLPFDGYRLHHFNHHEHNNGLKDYSSTWSTYKGKIKPHNIFYYSFCWPLFLDKARIDIQNKISKGLIPSLFGPRLRFQKLMLFAFYALLFIFSKKLFLVYFFSIYAGWVLISIHNYGQHPPLPGKKDQPTTYTSDIFNMLFFNNGFHWEHHNDPDKFWSDLKPSKKSKKISVPHILEPFNIINKDDDELLP